MYRCNLGILDCETHKEIFNLGLEVKSSAANLGKEGAQSLQITFNPFILYNFFIPPFTFLKTKFALPTKISLFPFISFIVLITCICFTCGILITRKKINGKSNNGQVFLVINYKQFTEQVGNLKLCGDSN